MRKRTPGHGRPSKGDRHLFPLAQMPAEATDTVLREAASRGLSHSEYLAVVITREHGLQTPWPSRTGPLLAAPRTHLDHPRLATRVPRAAADRVMDEAEAREMPYNRYLAAIVGRAHGFDLPLSERVAPLRSEEAFSLSA